MCVVLPKVSVLVPVYGVERFIERCAVSILEQDYPNIEIVFVDDCTPDRSIEVLESVIARYACVKDKVVVLHHAKNKGLAAARETALLAATGEYVMHVDSDDWIEPGCIAQMAALAAREDADMVVGDYSLNHADVVRYCSARILNPPCDYAREMVCRKPLYSYTMWSKLIRRGIHLGALPVEGLDYGEDYATMPRIAALCNKVVKLDKKVYNYRQGNQESYVCNFSEKSFGNMVAAVELLCRFFQDERHKLSADIVNFIKLTNKVFLVTQSSQTSLRLARRAWMMWPDAAGVSRLTRFDKLVYALACTRQFWAVRAVLKSGVWIRRIARSRFHK